jgi:diguanylate cyclase (GGDEF)-like protein
MITDMMTIAAVSRRMARVHRTSALIAILAMVGLLAVTSAVAGPTNARALSQLDIRIFATDQGLPHDSTLSLAVGHDGALWIGTWGGLTRYDGLEFRTFDRTSAHAVNDNGVLAIAPLADGSLALGMQGGQLVRSTNGVLEVLAGPEQGLDGNLLAVLEDAAGIWFGLEGGGLWYWQDGRLSRPAMAEIGESTSVFGLAHGVGGTVLAATARGAFRISATGGRVEPIAPDGFRAETSAAVLAIAEGRDGQLWIGTDAGLYRRTDVEGWQRVASAAVQTVHLDRSGALWAGTATSGVLRVTAKGIEQLDRRHGLPDSRVRAVLEDPAGGIWLGTNGGLVRLRDLPFRGLTARQGLAGEYVRSFLQRPGGQILVAGSGGLYEVDGLRVRAVATRNDDPASEPESLLSLALDPSGKIWVGTYADGLRRLGPSGPEHLPEGLRFADRAVRALLIARDGSLWVGMREGLRRVDPTEGRELPLAVVATNATVLALHEDPEGAIWVGTTSGLRRFSPDGVEMEIEGAGPQTRRPAFALADGQPGELWVGNSDGILRVTPTGVQAISHDQGLPFFRVLQLLRDPDGAIWLGSERGVFRALESDLREVATGKRQVLDGRLFGRDDGMPSRQCNGVAGPSAIRTRDGELWFATARGAAVVDPARIDDGRSSPLRVAFERIAINDRDVPVEELALVPPGRQSLQAQFGVVDLVNPGQVQFAWRLENLDSEWRDLGRERTLRINDLAPGRHTLLVTARHAGGDWSAEPARFDYEVAPALSQRPWFLPALIALVAVAVGTVAQVRSRTLRARETELAKRVDEQTAALAREMTRLAERDAEKTQLLAEIERKSRELARLAREDSLTGLANRRWFDEQFETAVANSADDGPAILLVDVDHFKEINDRYSHRAGDSVLCRLAGLLQRCFPEGLCGRYGGEEFIVMLGLADLAMAKERADQFRREVETTPWSGIAQQLVVTVSIGVSLRVEAEDPAKIISLADERLYQAKRSGRNRVC